MTLLLVISIHRLYIYHIGNFEKTGSPTEVLVHYSKTRYNDSAALVDLIITYDICPGIAP